MKEAIWQGNGMDNFRILSCWKNSPEEDPCANLSKAGAFCNDFEWLSVKNGLWSSSAVPPIKAVGNKRSFLSENNYLRRQIPKNDSGAHVVRQGL
jgi:hypothetical protein